MNPTVQQLFIDSNYYVRITPHETQENVIFAEFPSNLFAKPPLDSEVYQYYLEEDKLIVTRQSDKKTATQNVSKLSKRVIFMYDIMLKTLLRGLNINLIVAYNKAKENVKLIELLPQEERLLNRELKLIQMIHDFLQQTCDIDQIKKDGLYPIHCQLNDLMNRGGIV